MRRLRERMAVCEVGPPSVVRMPSTQSRFSSIDADNASVFAANAAKLKDSINAMVTKQGELKTQLDGTPLAITEPVPLYLLEAMGLQNKTPEEFSEAIEEDSDVPPTVLRETLAKGGRICTKSELLRAGIQLLLKVPAADAKALVEALPVVPKGKSAK